jgi:hypothetical protein
MNCPKCNIEMGPTYEPYEYRCSKCGYWFDSWTGKEVTFDDTLSAVDEEPEDPCHDWETVWEDPEGGDPELRCEVCMICSAQRIIKRQDNGEWVETSFEPGDSEALAYEGDEQ